MKIRPYQKADKANCLDIFSSNCPLYFDTAEYDLFSKWLDHQGGQTGYESPTYQDAEKDAYYVIENKNALLIACGGFYIYKNMPEARMAWGMVHAAFHAQSFGSTLYQYRKDAIKETWPQHKITLGTSQHTFKFYEKMGLKLINTIPAGYGPDLDQYNMEENQNK